MNINWKNQVMKGILVVLGIFSSIGGFISAFSNKQNGLNPSIGVIFALIFLTSALTYLLQFMENVTLKKKIEIGMITGFIVVGIIGESFLQYGFMGLVNSMDLGLKFQEAFRPDFLLIYVSVFLSFVQVKLILKEKHFLHLMINTAILLVPMGCGMMPGAIYACMFIVYVVGTFTLSKSDKQWILTAETMAVTGIICLLVLVIFPQKSYKQWTMFSSVRNKIESLFMKEQIEPTYEMTSGGVNGGTIGNVDEISYSNETMLTLRTGMTGSVYLKGFVGSVFENNQWRDLTNQEYQTKTKDYKTVFDTFAKSDFYFSNQKALLYAAIESDNETILSLYPSLSDYLSNIQRRKYTVIYEGEDFTYGYMPYGSLYFVQNKSSMDGYYFNDKTSITSYAYDDQSRGNEENFDYDAWKAFIDSYQGENEKLLDYTKAEKKYRAFVYDLHTKISDHQKMYLENAKNAIPEFHGDGSMRSVILYAQTVKDYFNDSYEYTLAPGKVPDGKDAICYFLDESQQGYCTYFASAATLIFRNAGIPCRYVEGYSTYVSSGNAVEQKETTDERNSNTFSATDSYTQYTVNVTDADAHAWVEIYIDGYGWIPIDVTPGNQNRQNTTYFPKDEIQSDITVIKETSGNSPSVNSGLESENVLENGLVDGNNETEEGKSDVIIEPHIKDHYDTFAEYLHDNTTGQLDYGIVMPILGKYLLKVLKIILYVACVIALLLLCFLIPQRIARRKLNALFTYFEKQECESRNKQILGIYVQLEKLGAFFDIKRDIQESYMEYGDRLIQSKLHLEKDEVKAIVSCALKVSFGKQNISDSEMKDAVYAIVHINKDLYGNLGKGKALLFKYICHLG